jgi:hypothetical protein
MASPRSTSLSVAAQSAADVATKGPDYDENGLDLSLVRYSLSPTPTERLKAVENFMNAMASVRPAPALPADSERAK